MAGLDLIGSVLTLLQPQAGTSAWWPSLSALPGSVCWEDS
jgi:hypothetical protein